MSIVFVYIMLGNLRKAVTWFPSYNNSWSTGKLRRFLQHPIDKQLFLHSS